MSYNWVWFLLLINIKTQEDKLVFLWQIMVNGIEEASAQTTSQSAGFYTLMKNQLNETGMKQMYTIGRSTLEQYPTFWPEVYNQNYFKVYSGNSPS